MGRGERRRGGSKAVDRVDTSGGGEWDGRISTRVMHTYPDRYQLYIYIFIFDSALLLVALRGGFAVFYYILVLSPVASSCLLEEGANSG